MKRNTHQQMMVLDVMLQLKGCHPTADIVYEKVKLSVPSISRATVYRILNQQVAQGVIQRIPTAVAADRYDDRTERHYHMRCSKCAAVVDIDIPAIQGLCDNKLTPTGEQITGYDIIFYGYCSSCKSN